MRPWRASAIMPVLGGGCAGLRPGSYGMVFLKPFVGRLWEDGGGAPGTSAVCSWPLHTSVDSGICLAKLTIPSCSAPSRFAAFFPYVSVAVSFFFFPFVVLYGCPDAAGVYCCFSGRNWLPELPTRPRLSPG